MKRILIIEDDRTLRENTSIFLEEEGYEVIKAKDGSEGVQMALQYLPDLILCDIAMPKLNGYEVYNTLQEIKSTSLIPFIFLTAKTEKEDIRAGMQLGADDYITKPFDYDDLLNTIATRLIKHEKLSNANVEKYRGLIDNPLTGVYVLNQNLDFDFTNIKFNNIVGYTTDELTRMQIEDILYSHDKETISQEIKKCFNGAQNSFKKKVEVINKKGEVIPVEIYGSITKVDKNATIIGNLMHLTIPNGIETNVRKELPENFNLTVREVEVLNLICKGYSTSEIAEKLFISNRTVDGHRASLINKTGSKNTADLVMFAVKNKLVDV